MFPSTSSWEKSGLSGEQNYLFPSGPYIKCTFKHRASLSPVSLQYYKVVSLPFLKKNSSEESSFVCSYCTSINSTPKLLIH